MAKRRTPSDDELSRVADLRANGQSWERIAEQLGSSATTIRKWPQQYHEKWRECHLAAERRIVAEATVEAVITLRKQLRSEDEKSAREAARHLLQLRLSMEKLCIPLDGMTTRTPTDLESILSYLDAEHHAQIEHAESETLETDDG